VSLPRGAPLVVAISAAWLVPALLAVLDVYMQARLSHEAAPNPWLLLWTGGDWLIYGALTPLVFRIARLFPLRSSTLAPNLALHFLFSLLLCVVWAGTGLLLRYLIVPGPEGEVSLEFAVRWLFITLPFGVAVYFSVVGIEHGAYYFRAVQERDTQAARLAAQLAEARLGALRMQLQPHFLFNSLNAIGVLVRDHDTATAGRMVELLSDVLRQVLQANRVQERSLADELAFIRGYLAIEEIRFADRLRVVIDVAPPLEAAQVPSFVLQPIVENAIRHGVAKRSSAGLVLIEARRDGDALVLSVSDDGPGVVGEPTSGVGLANTRDRLKTLYGDLGSLTLGPRSDGGTVVAIRLPYRLAETSQP
jgi:signal transduction histidine kinase